MSVWASYSRRISGRRRGKAMRAASRICLGLQVCIMLSALAACSSDEIRSDKATADHVALQREAAAELLHDYLRQLAAGDKYALRFPFYCVLIAGRNGKIEVDDQFVNELSLDLPGKIGAKFAPASQCEIVNQVYHLPSGEAANTLVAKWTQDAGPREYWQAGAIGPGGLAGGGGTYWVAFPPDGPAIERDSRWIVF